MSNEFIDFQIYHNTMHVIKRTPSGLLTTSKNNRLNITMIEDRIKEYPYRGQRRIKDHNVERYSLPSIASVFYRLIYKGKLPSVETLSANYLKRYFTDLGSGRVMLNNTNASFSIEGIEGRVFRAYPSLLRDLHFYLLCEESMLFDEVIYSFDKDAKKGVDLTIKHQGQEFVVALFVNTPRSKMFKSKKYNRHDTLNVPEICIAINPFNKAYQVGDYALYQKEHVLYLKQEIMKQLIVKQIA